MKSNLFGFSSKKPNHLKGKKKDDILAKNNLNKYYAFVFIVLSITDGSETATNAVLLMSLLAFMNGT